MLLRFSEDIALLGHEAYHVAMYQSMNTIIEASNVALVPFWNVTWNFYEVMAEIFYWDFYLVMEHQPGAGTFDISLTSELFRGRQLRRETQDASQLG